MPASFGRRPTHRGARLAAGLATCGLLATLAAAAGAVRPSGRLDGYLLPRGRGVIATAPRNVDRLNASDAARRTWDGFRDRRGRGFTVYLDERTGLPTLVSGRGITEFATEGAAPADLAELEMAARAFLGAEAAVLGDWQPFLVLDHDASVELRPGYWKLVFRQQVGDVQVENARLDLHIDGGRLTMFGFSNWSRPAIDSVPAISATEAAALLDRYLDGALSTLQRAGEPQLVLIAVAAAQPAGSRRWSGTRGAGLEHRLVWRLSYRDLEGPALWVGEVDAHAGEMTAFYDGAHYAGIRGGVFPQQPGGDCAAGGCELDGYPMPYADWTEAGQTEAIGDAYGNFSCSDPAAAYETRLAGAYVEINDSCGAITATAACEDTLQLGLKVAENCDGAPVGSPGNTAAARSAYYHVNRAAEVGRYYDPANAWLMGRVTVHSNWQGSTCNASYGADRIYVYPSGAVCANSGEIQGIVVHEWGHGYDENDGGGWDNPSEAYADMPAMFASRQSCFGSGLFIDGRTCSGYGDSCLSCTGFRDHDWAARQANTPATPQVFVLNNCDIGTGAGPCGGEVHCETYPIDEAMFDLATRDLPAAGLDPATAWQRAERLWYGSRPGSGGEIYTCALPDSDSCAAGSWYQQLRAADDDDADLTNGTPHAAAIYAAFARHNIACGLPGDPENQSTSSCPTLAVPWLAATTQAGGTALSWSAVAGASEYVVYRGDLGCDRQQIAVTALPVGILEWLDVVGDPDMIRSYRVEAAGTNPVCRSPMSNCVASHAGPRLQLNDRRLVESGTLANGNGRLDPGETVELPATLFNGGSATAIKVVGRLRAVDPAQARAVEPIAGWVDLAVGAESESNAPHFTLTVQDAGCGDLVPLELTMTADGAAERSANFAFQLGDKNRDFLKSENAPLSRFNTAPVLSTFLLTDDTVIDELDVSVDIAHTRPGDLIVELGSPHGTTVRLHDRSAGTGGITTRYDLLTDPDGPGTMGHFQGESTAGTWTLSVENTVVGGGQGSVGNWVLHVTSAGAFDCDPWVCPEPPPAVATDGLTVDLALDGGDGSLDLLFAWNGVAGAAGYHVLHSRGAGFDDAVDLTGRTTGATTLSLEDGPAILPDLVFFQVRAVNACNQESP